MISVANISKKFGGQTALDSVSLNVQPGELFGLIGPDGSGKTTLFRILATLISPDSGAASIGKWDIDRHIPQIRSSIGYMPGKFSLYQDLTVEENLQFFAAVFGTTVRENYDLIRDIYAHIEPFKNRKAGALSGGMKQKLALSCALIHRPEALLLDEPTTGVDPVSRKELWDMLKGLKKSGITIVASTPYMEEAALCERIALIQKGKILSVDAPEKIRKDFTRTLIEVKSGSGMYKLIEDLRYYDRAHTYFAFGESLHYTDKTDDDSAIDELRNYLTGQGHQNVSLKQIPADIEDRFMELMTEETIDL